MSKSESRNAKNQVIRRRLHNCSKKHEKASYFGSKKIVFQEKFKPEFLEGCEQYRKEILQMSTSHENTFAAFFSLYFDENSRNATTKRVGKN